MSESTVEMTEATLSKALNDEAEAEYALWKAQEWVKIARRGALTARRLAEDEAKQARA